MNHPVCPNCGRTFTDADKTRHWQKTGKRMVYSNIGYECPCGTSCAVAWSTERDMVVPGSLLEKDIWPEIAGELKTDSIQHQIKISG